MSSSGPAVLRDDRRCFACGQDNPHGLRLRFDYGDGVANSTFVAGAGFGGWTTIVHGGIIVTLLDEAMAHAAIASGIRAVTARLEVRFRKAAPVDQQLHIEGRLEGRRGRLLTLAATVSGADGTLYAEGHGRFVADDGSSG